MSSSTVTTDAIEAVVQPLCEATGELFRPLILQPWDWLEIELDDEARRFIIEPRTYAQIEEGTCKWCGATEDRHFKHGHLFEPLRKAFSLAGVDYGESGMPPSQDATELLKRFPERKHHKGGQYVVAGTDFSALLIHTLWPKDRLRFKTPDAELLYQFLLKRFASQAHAAKIAADYKINKTIPDLPADFVPHPEYPPLPFQRVPVAMFAFREAAALFMQQGTGKTATSIARVMLESRRKYSGQVVGVKQGMYRVLVICPNQVRYNWQIEFERFATMPGKVTVLRGDSLSRGRKLIDSVRPEPDCVWSASVLGYDSVESMLEHLLLVPWDLVILDESHYIKSPNARRWKAAIKILRDEGKIRQRMILTGTPIANNPMDLWTQLEFLGDGLSGFMTHANFKNFHGKWDKGNFGGSVVQKLVGLKNIPLLQERLARLAFMVTKEEAGLDLPDKVYEVAEVEMTKQQADWYAKLRDQMALEIEQENAEAAKEGKRLSVSHILTKLLRLAQVTSGFVRWDDVWDEEGNLIHEGYVEHIPGENPKLEAMIAELTSEGRDPKGKTIIWSCFKASITKICERLEEEGIGYVEYWGAVSEKDRQKAVHYFNTDPNIKVFVGNPATAGAGLNLLGYDPSDPELVDTYTDQEFYFDQGWSAILRSQSEDRAHRKGTRTNIRIVDFVVPGTIDDEIRKRVTRKIDIANKIQDVNNILRDVLNFKTLLAE